MVYDDGGGPSQRPAWRNFEQDLFVVKGGESKEFDLTFSFGKRVTRRYVNKFLADNLFNGDYRKMSDYIDTMIVDEWKFFSRQVMITCHQEGQNDDLVERLMPLVQRREICNCHAYSSKELPVIVDWLHGSVDIQNDFVKNYLEKEIGPVKSWRPKVDPQTLIKTGEYIFLMDGAVLEKNPIPPRIKFNQRVVKIYYRGQPVRCRACGESGHKAFSCKKYPPISRTDPEVQRQIEEEARKERALALQEQIQRLTHMNRKEGDAPNIKKLPNEDGNVSGSESEDRKITPPPNNDNALPKDDAPQLTAAATNNPLLPVSTVDPSLEPPKPEDPEAMEEENTVDAAVSDLVQRTNNVLNLSMPSKSRTRSPSPQSSSAKVPRRTAAAGTSAAGTSAIQSQLRDFVENFSQDLNDIPTAGPSQEPARLPD